MELAPLAIVSIPRGPRMSARSKARKRALDLIYASEMRNRSAIEALEEQAEATQLNDYTVELVHGVVEHRARLDEVISSYVQGWTLDRMPAVDRNVLRLATYEVLFVDDVPDAVAVSEALNLVRNLSTDESPAFVNGVLGNIVRDRDTLVG
jgi:N utilization substance protein B